MRDNINFIIRAVFFFVFVAVMIFATGKILVPKTYYNYTYPSTTTFTGFYKMKRNTIDVLFFGSSLGVTSFIPQELYDNYGICSYNLSSEQQNPFVSYYWLREACRYQKPKSVIIETHIFFPYNSSEVFNSAESCTRYAFDPMKFSNIKMAALSDIKKYDKKQDIWTYYFPHKRFHTRIKGGLGENDFSFAELESHFDMKGYSCLDSHCGIEFTPLVVEEEFFNETPMVPLMEEYVKKIIDFCNTNGIKLIFVSTPITAQTNERNNTMRSFSKTNGILYIDFNENEIYSEIDYDFSYDSADGGHNAYWGAKKITDYLGNILTQNRIIEPKTDTQWEISRTFYNHMILKAKLKNIRQIDDYIDTIKDRYFAIFISVKDEESSILSDKTIENLKVLGLNPLVMKQKNTSYIAILLPNNKPIEKCSFGGIQETGQFRRGRDYYSIFSGNHSSIVINGQEFSKNSRGINIVVYDLNSRQVFDSVCFDTKSDFD